MKQHTFLDRLNHNLKVIEKVVCTILSIILIGSTVLAIVEHEIARFIQLWAY